MTTPLIIISWMLAYDDDDDDDDDESSSFSFFPAASRKSSATVNNHELLEEVRLDRLCSICMDNFDDEKGVLATRLPCLHIFHGNCLLQWLQIDHKCPCFCQVKIDPDPNHDDDDDPDFVLRLLCKLCHTLYIQFNIYETDEAVIINGRSQRKPKPLIVPSRCHLHPRHIYDHLSKIMSVFRPHDVPLIVAKIYEALAASASSSTTSSINVDIYYDFKIPGSYHGQVSSTKPADGYTAARLARLVRVDGVCMNVFDDDGLVATRLPCFHVFHGECIGSWLEIDPRCPLCRYPLDNERCSDREIFWRLWMIRT